MSRRRPSAAARGRSLARRLAMQALYQWQLTGQSAAEILAQFGESEESAGADLEYFAELVRAVIAGQGALDVEIGRHADRPVEQLDPVERAILWCGVYELKDRLDVPYRVVINEAVELTKRFGATDAHRYVNALLDRVAQEHRAAERRMPPASSTTTE
jgi:N utilization substance protein B